MEEEKEISKNTNEENEDSSQAHEADSMEEKSSESKDMNIKYAGFWRRFGAYLIDGIIIGLIAGLLSSILGIDGFTFESTSSSAEVSFNASAQLALFLIGFVYFVAFQASHMQATPGKRIFGMKVIDEKGNRISYTTAAIRNVSKILSSLLFMLGYIMAAFTEKKQALHDMIAKTYVIMDKE